MKRALLEALALGAIFAIALGVLGPCLDAQPDRRGEWLQTERLLQQEGTLARWEAEARARCAEDHGDNAGLIQLPDGAVVCTDKHGRRARNVITIARKVEAP